MHAEDDNLKSFSAVFSAGFVISLVGQNEEGVNRW